MSTVSRRARWIVCSLLVAMIGLVAAGVQSARERSGPGDDAVIAVARDISPAWADSLEEARVARPAQFQAQLLEFRRLRSLAILRERRPTVYQQRIRELQLDYQARELGTQYVAAVAAGRSEQAMELERQLQTLSLQLVDANLRSRASELSELDGLIKELRVELQHDSELRTDKAEEVTRALLTGQAPPPLGGRSFDGRRPTGPGPGDGAGQAPLDNAATRADDAR
ncbi:MAG: hypothetical protein O2819_05810 [Planctomycetota bacterium]|nr:hypothetical protein [Planctomycetota bacterium]